MQGDVAQLTSPLTHPASETLAPEIPGAYAYIQQLAHYGIVPACGHTDATFDQIQQAASHGLRHAVHTFNAMRPLHHREPGTVGAVLTDERSGNHCRWGACSS